MKNSILTIALLCFSAFFTNSSKAQNVAHINYMEIVQLMPSYMTASSEYDIYQQSWMEVLSELEKKYLDDQANYEKEQAKPVPNQTKMRILLSNMEKTQADYQEMSRIMQDSLQQKMMKLVEPIKKEVAEAVAAVAKEKGYSHVIDNSEGILIYADPAHDISEAVKAKLGIKEKPTSNSAAGKPMITRPPAFPAGGR